MLVLCHRRSILRRQVKGLGVTWPTVRSWRGSPVSSRASAGLRSSSRRRRCSTGICASSGSVEAICTGDPVDRLCRPRPSSLSLASRWKIRGGLSPAGRRAEKTRGHGSGDQRAQRVVSRWFSTLATPERSERDQVPTRPGERHPRKGLLHRRYRLAQQALRAVRHRGRESSGPARRGHETPGRDSGDAGSSELRLRP